MFPSPHRDLLRTRLQGSTPGLHVLVGPGGVGKTTLLRQVLGEAPGTLHWEIPPLEEEGTLEDLRRLAGGLLGPLPAIPLRPDLLPVAGSGVAWVEGVEGTLLALARQASADASEDELGTRRVGVLALDGMELLAGARRRLPDEILDLWRRTRDRGLRVHLVTTWRERPPEAWIQEGVVLPLSAHPFRAAALAHGARDPADAFRRWAVFGHHPGHLPGRLPGHLPVLPAGRTPGQASGQAPGQVSKVAAGTTGSPRSEGETLEDAVVRRVLTPGGDLHDAPLRRLSTEVQVPRRYVEILASLAVGESAWGPVASRVGTDAGNRLAPYLRRLEADGWIQVLEPLDGRPGGRRRRYSLLDPFSAFWFGLVFPVRSLLHREDPRRLFRDRIAPRLPGYMALRLRELARLWIEVHAAERLPAAAREVGGLWAGDVEVEVAARLANGQVCYGICQGPEGFAPGAGDRGELASGPKSGNNPGQGTGQRSGQEPEQAAVQGDVALLIELERRMREVRWGIGREARAPLVFLGRSPSDELRRRVTRDPLARLLTLSDLMGSVEGST